MRRLLNFKVWRVVFSTLVLAALTLGAAPLASVSADNGEGTIALTVNNPPAGNPYVDVQWQDPAGAWHSVGNWLVPFDESANGYVVNYVDPQDFGTGPFRWILYDKLDGKVLGTSDSFMFPTDDTNWVWSTITLPARATAPVLTPDPDAASEPAS